MKFVDCLNLGKECGLETVKEAVINVDMHAMNMFAYAKISEEVNQIIKEKDDVFSKSGFKYDSKIEDVLNWIQSQDK